jgi:hypothetical protein
MNYMESVKYLKNYPPDILGALGGFAKRAVNPPASLELPALSEELGMSLGDMVKNKSLSPIKRGQIIKLLKQDEELNNRVVMREQSQKNASALAQRLKTQYAGGFGE